MIRVTLPTMPDVPEGFVWVEGLEDSALTAMMKYGGDGLTAIMTGPEDQWFGFALSEDVYMTGSLAFVIDSDDGENWSMTQYNLGDYRPEIDSTAIEFTEDDTSNIALTQNDVVDGTRTISVFIPIDFDDWDMTVDPNTILFARGTDHIFAVHEWQSAVQNVFGTSLDDRMPYVETDVVKFVPVSLDIVDEEEMKIDVALTTQYFYVRVSQQYERDIWHAFAFSDNAKMGGSLGFFSLPGDENAIHELLDTYEINPDQPQNIKGLGFMVYDGGISGQGDMRESYCVFNRDTFTLWDLSTSPPEFLLIAKGQTDVLGWHGGHGKQQVQMGIDFFPAIEPRTVNKMYVELTLTGMTQEMFAAEAIQAAIVVSVNSHIKYQLDDVVLTFDGTSRITLVGSAHTPDRRAENIKWINSVEADVSVLNGLLKEQLLIAGISGVEVTGYGPASLGHTVKIEITATGITSENFEQAKEPIKKAIKDTVPNVKEENILLKLKSESSRRVLAASVIEAEIQTDSEEESNTLATSIKDSTEALGNAISTECANVGIDGVQVTKLSEPEIVAPATTKDEAVPADDKDNGTSMSTYIIVIVVCVVLLLLASVVYFMYCFDPEDKIDGPNDEDKGEQKKVQMTKRGPEKAASGRTTQTSV